MLTFEEYRSNRRRQHIIRLIEDYSVYVRMELENEYCTSGKATPISTKEIVHKTKEILVKPATRTFENSCGGCGATSSNQRCIGCYHQF